MKNVVGQFGNVWQGTSFIQRLIFITLALGFVLGFLGITFWFRKPEYSLLYSSLSQKEAGGIVEYLRDKDIPYRIRDNGRAIMVPPNMIYEVRMNLAKSGLPSGDIGFELFDRVKFGMSDLAQKVNYRRALQGELSKTISHLDGVEWAKVQIVIPEPSLFIEDEKPAKASVILKTKSGRVLKPSQIAGIRHLVGASAERLSPENVTIADSRGNLLSKAGGPTLSGVITNQLDLKRKIEDYYTSKALGLVEKITGPGEAIVRVSADLDFKHVDEKQIKYDQDNKVPINQTITTQSTETPQILSGGENSSKLKSSKEKEETETTQYALSKVERAISEHVATVKRLSVAVLVNGTYKEEETEGGKVERTFMQRPDEELNKIAAIVKQSIGLDESPPRNDKFELQCVEFHGQVPVFIDEESIETGNKKEFLLSVVKNSSLAIAVIAFIMFALKALKRLSKPQPGYATYSPAELQDGYDVGEEAKAKVNERRVALRDAIVGRTKDDPKTTSNLIRKWVREGD